MMVVVSLSAGGPTTSIKPSSPIFMSTPADDVTSVGINAAIFGWRGSTSDFSQARCAASTDSIGPSISVRDFSQRRCVLRAVFSFVRHSVPKSPARGP